MFLGSLRLPPLIVPAPVQHAQVDLPGVPLQHVGLVGAAAEELEALAVGLDEGPGMARVDLVARVHA